jgi:hypothetical protein
MRPAHDKQNHPDTKGMQGKQQKWSDRYPYSLFGFAYGVAICLIVFMLSLANIAITILKHWSVWLIPFSALIGLIGLSCTAENIAALVRYFRSLESTTHAEVRTAERRHKETSWSS